MNEKTLIDPILKARLELLEQVRDEVIDIQRAIADQNRRLAAVEEFLRHRGQLAGLTSQVKINVRDAIARLEDEEWGPAGEEALERLNAVPPLLKDKLDVARQDALQEFIGIKNWSVAALDSSQLTNAIKLYARALSEIRSSQQPWAKYEEQLNSRGEQLFNAYLELFGSIAVRGIGPPDNLDDERRDLSNFLLSFFPASAPMARLPMPNLLTRSTHVQLGYLSWSLWAMPLLARDVGAHLIRQGAFDQPAEHYQLVCADAFAVFAMGPSYTAAALFLELDPDGRPVGGAPSDSVRAKLMLDLLPRLAGDAQRAQIEVHTELLRSAWEQACNAVGGRAVTPANEDVEAVEKFLGRLQADYPDLGYDLSKLASRNEEAERLTAGQEVNGTGQIWDLLVSMWWARVTHPEAESKTIDTQARLALEGSRAHVPSTAARVRSGGKARVR